MVILFKVYSADITVNKKDVDYVVKSTITKTFLKIYSPPCKHKYLFK